MSRLFGGLIKHKQYAGTIFIEKLSDSRKSIQYKWNSYKSSNTAYLPDYSLACIFELSDELYEKYKDILGIDRKHNSVEILPMQDDIKFLLGILEVNKSIIYKNKEEFKKLMEYE